MYLRYEDLLKILILLNAQNKGWKIGVSDLKTFYLIKEKNGKDKTFVNDLVELFKKPINFNDELNNLINKKNL
jgi:hypothetical protein